MNEGEEFIATFPGMAWQPGNKPFDFLFKPERSRIEVKFSNPQPIPYGYDSCFGQERYVCQLRWVRIDPRKFDYLILTAKDEDKRWRLWLVPAKAVRRFLVGANFDTINYTLGRAVRKLDVFGITKEQLALLCRAGSLRDYLNSLRFLKAENK
jgi:hypothetical protein